MAATGAKDPRSPSSVTTIIAALSAMANASEAEASDLRNDLHQLKRCCRQQTALTWKS